MVVLNLDVLESSLFIMALNQMQGTFRLKHKLAKVCASPTTDFFNGVVNLTNDRGRFG